MGVASWRAGSSLPLRYQNGLSGRERRLIKPPRDDLYDLAVNAIGGRDAEKVHLPRGLTGSFETGARGCAERQAETQYPPPHSSLGDGSPRRD